MSITRPSLPCPACLLVLAAASCVSHQDREAMMDVEFLTRDGCANSPALRDSLLAAVESLDFRVRVVTVDVGRLPADDYRTGFGTPTVLVAGEDLFGVPRPAPASPT